MLIDGIKRERPFRFKWKNVFAKAGGGALPETEIPSYGVALESTEITVEEIESRMRNLSVPVIGRIKEGRFLLDMRTFSEEGIEYLATQIRHVMERKHN